MRKSNWAGWTEGFAGPRIPRGERLRKSGKLPDDQCGDRGEAQIATKQRFVNGFHSRPSRRPAFVRRRVARDGSSNGWRRRRLGDLNEDFRHCAL